MATPQVGITNAGGKVAIQAGNYHAHGDTILKYAYQTDSVHL